MTIKKTGTKKRKAPTRKSVVRKNSVDRHVVGSKMEITDNSYTMNREKNEK